MAKIFEKWDCNYLFGNGNEMGENGNYGKGKLIEITIIWGFGSKLEQKILFLVFQAFIHAFIWDKPSKY